MINLPKGVNTFLAYHLYIWFIILYKFYVRVLDLSWVRFNQISSQLIKMINYAIRSDLKKHHTITNHMNTKNDDIGNLLKLWF